MRYLSYTLKGILHYKGCEIQPMTLECGDVSQCKKYITIFDLILKYILTPEICIERKSISDLVSSFTSGRLYNQVEAMTRLYKNPILLIEFSEVLRATHPHK